MRVLAGSLGEDQVAIREDGLLVRRLDAPCGTLAGRKLAGRGGAGGRGTRCW